MLWPLTWAVIIGTLPAVSIAVTAFVLTEFSGADTFWTRRLQTLTVGFLTPFYFLRAETLVSLPVLVSAPVVFLLLLGSNVISKIFGLYPIIGMFRFVL